MANLNFEEIYPGVIVYRGMLSNPEKAYEVMMNSESSSGGKYFFKTPAIGNVSTTSPILSVRLIINVFVLWVSIKWADFFIL